MKKQKLAKYFGVFMALNILFEVISPSVALALTNGTMQPEFQDFEPANSSEMVDLFSGDFKYNIPLMDVDGYPLNISYKAGQGMESEASWVGLGWSLNPGVLNRSVRGIPDDFKGETMSSYTRIKPVANMAVGFQLNSYIGASPDIKLVGAGAQVGLSKGLLLSYNNYKGFGVELQTDVNGSLHANFAEMAGASISGGVGMNISSQDGGSYTTNYSKGFTYGLYSASIGEGTSLNTRTGAETKTYFGSQSIGYKGSGVSLSRSHTIPTGPVAYAPRIMNDFKGRSGSLSVRTGAWGCADLTVLGLPFIIQSGYILGFNGYYSINHLQSNVKNLPGYGYMYLENSDENSLMDFNRFRDGAIHKETPNIAYSSLTYDVFSAHAQGMNMNFRPHRSDVGIVHDNKTVNDNKGYFGGGEAGFLLFTHFLIHALKNVGYGESKQWDLPINNHLNFISKDITTAQDRFYEKHYFKQMGQLSARDASFDAAIGGEGVITPQLTAAGFGYDANSGLPGISAASSITRSKRDIRSNNIVCLTADEANQYSLDKQIKLASNTAPVISAASRMEVLSSPVSRLSKTYNSNNYSVNHHISEASIRTVDGTKYTYGIPVYNLYKKRVMFNASRRKETTYNVLNDYPSGTGFSDLPLPKSDHYQLVEYDPNNDLSSNLRGQDNMYRSDETTPYSTSNLLTSITSVDYVDLTGDGLTYDDLGSYTKFNYIKDNNYQWREPYCVPTNDTKKQTLGQQNYHAMLDQGLFADKLDDKASYEYGVRESYYAHSIETKNYIAYFELDQTKREDNIDVQSEHGAKSINPNSYKLKRIKLYSKSEMLRNPSNPIPIKTVEFEYDYSLCPGIFNSTNGGGKLTLKKIYFTYGDSKKSSLSPYIFKYADNDHDVAGTEECNFSYDPSAVDRWGSYKPNTGGYATGQAGTLNNSEFPYAEQNKTNADKYSAAWNLTQIKTPSGSDIKITYESDDYGYVQNERAGQMLKVFDYRDAVNTSDNLSDPSYVPNTTIFNGNYNANYMVIDLSGLTSGIPTSLTFAQATQYAKNNLFKVNKDMYFKCFVKLAGPANSLGLTDDYWDFVSGYANAEDVGVFANTSGNINAYNDANGIQCYKYAYIKLENQNAYNSVMVNPVSQAGWQYMRTYIPRLAYPGSEPANMGDGSHKPLKQFVNTLIGLGVALADFAAGIVDEPNTRFYVRKFCNKIDYGKSFVRAYVPNRIKKGGGHRVKQITTNDNWNTMTSNNEVSSEYGQVFDYTTVDTDKKNISSGVAINEPLIGGDENSMRYPIKYDLTKSHAPNDNMFQDGPYCEMLYPAPGVGYSHVTVKNISYANVCPIGKTEFKYYTARDFPVIEKTNGLTKELYQNDPIEDWTIVKSLYTIFHATQGFVVKLNDMHGKLKEINTYGENDPVAPISGAKYFYKQQNYKGNSKELVTTAKTISQNNVVANEVISRDIDVTIDNRENINKSSTLGSNLLIEISACANYVSISTDPQISDQTFGTRSASTTKVIQQYGILEKVESFDNKTRTSTENLLWDRNTGDVVLTKTTNYLEQTTYNPNKPIYTFNYPAYWMYRQMGNEFSRHGLKIKFTNAATPSASSWNTTNGIIQLSFVAPSAGLNLLTPGDEVVVQNNSGNYIGEKYWVTEDKTSSVSTSFGTFYNYILVDKNGTKINSSTISGLSTAANDNNYITIIRPMQRNQMSASAGSINMLTNPVPAFAAPVLNQDIISASALTYCQGWDAYGSNNTQQQTNCFPINFTPASNNYFNPYTTGMYGNWRPWKTYGYKANRNYSSTQPNISSDGKIPGFIPFWDFNVVWFPYQAPTRWVPSSENVVISPYGYVMQSKNAIGIPNAKRYGFNHTLPILEANNAEVTEVGFDSFEDYDIIYPTLANFNTCSYLGNDHLGFFNQINLPGGSLPKPTVTNSTAHTGRYSLGFAAGQNVNIGHSVLKAPYQMTIPINVNAYGFSKDDIERFGSCAGNTNNQAKLLDKLNFKAGKYIVSFWVKAQNAALDYSPNFSFDVQYTPNSSSPFSILPPGNIKKSKIINGWQKFDCEFTITNSAPNSSINYVFNNTSASALYMDDFRVQPYNSTMTCYVYDPYQLRLWSMLDDRNYADYKEYDVEGVLVRNKKETEKGIFTIQESRSANTKN